MADHLPSGLLELDADGLIVAANSVVAQWAALPVEDLVGSPFRSVARRPEPPESPDAEFLPAAAQVVRADGSFTPVLVAVGEPDASGHSFVTLFEASEQRAFRERLQSRFGLTQRTQIRLELVIGASIAFAEATSETDLAEVLAATTARAYAAEEAVVFLLDDDLQFRQVAGSNPLAGVGEVDLLTGRARELRTVLKIAGVPAAYELSEAVGVAFEKAGVQSVIVAPIRQGDELLGIMAAFFHHPRQFDEQASPLADALAGQAARAVSGLRLQERLEHQAMHDDTTGLPNRRLLEEWMDGSRKPASTILGVLFVDLDGFKTINDRLGHHVGDELLRQVADRLRATTRDSDIVARYGGDEFVIICEVPDEAAAIDLAERVKNIIRAPYPILPPGTNIGASVGVSISNNGSSESVDGLVRMADQAMYRAKSAGGNRVARFGPSVSSDGNEEPCDTVESAGDELVERPRTSFRA